MKHIIIKYPSSFLKYFKESFWSGITMRDVFFLQFFFRLRKVRFFALSSSDWYSDLVFECTSPWSDIWWMETEGQRKEERERKRWRKWKALFSLLTRSQEKKMKKSLNYFFSIEKNEERWRMSMSMQQTIMPIQNNFHFILLKFFFSMKDLLNKRLLIRWGQVDEEW